MVVCFDVLSHKNPFFFNDKHHACEIYLVVVVVDSIF